MENAIRRGRRACLGVAGLLVGILAWGCSGTDATFLLPQEAEPSDLVIEPPPDDDPAEQQDLDSLIWEPSFEPDYNNLSAQPWVEPATSIQQDTVTVRPDQLQFSVAETPEVGEWAPGRVVVAGPGKGAGNNPLGFARRVVSVREENGLFVVDTERVGLEDVVHGDFQQSFDFSESEEVDLAQLDLEWAADNLYASSDTVFLPGEPLVEDGPPEEVIDLLDPSADPIFGSIGRAVGGAAKKVAKAAAKVVKKVTAKSFKGSVSLKSTISGSGAYPLFRDLRYSKTLRGTKYPVEVFIAGGAGVDASVKVKPAFQIGARVPNVLRKNAPRFTSWVNLDARTQVAIKLDVDLEAGVTSANVGGSALERRLNADADFAQEVLGKGRQALFGDADMKPAGGWSRTLFISKPRTKTFFAGPVPVVLVSTFQVDLDCGFEAKASIKGTLALEQSATFKLKASYEQGRKPKVKVDKFDRRTRREVKILGGGSLSVSCGIIPRINTLVYDTAGLTAGLRNSLVGKAELSSKCTETSVTPKGDLDVGLYGNVGVQVGARLQPPGSSSLGKSGQKSGFDIGPLEPWNKEFSIYSKQWSLSRGFGYCTPLCRNRRLDGRETSRDCGGGACGSCDAGQACKKNSDCTRPATCNGGVCRVDSCLDGVTSGDETGIDCGGERCAQRCAVGKECAEATDCASGYCDRRTGGSLGTCVADHCSSGVQDEDESGVDCGGQRCPACATGTLCSVGADCVSGYSNGMQCVENSCQDRVVSGGETDLDCGGSSSCWRCGVGLSCLRDSDCSLPPYDLMCVAGKCARPGEPCAPGSVNDDDDPTTACTLCSAGEYCAGGNASVIPCSAGTSDADNDPATACSACAPGEYCSGAAANAEPCPAGSVDDDLDPSTPCSACAAGQLCSGGAAAAAACAAGTWDHDADPATACVACAPGEYCAGGDASAAACAPGSVDTDADPSTACVACSAGDYCAGGSAGAVSCPAGTVDGDDDPASACVACSAGDYCAGGSAGAVSCPAGTVDGDHDPASACVACSAGNYCVGGSVGAVPCVPGSVDADDDPSTACVACSAGDYCAGADADAVACAAGSVDHDSDPATACAVCAPGDYCPGGTEATTCAAGTEDADDDPTTACTACSAGDYCAGGTSGAVACAAGSVDHDSDPASACSVCFPGEFCAGGDASPVLCAPGTVDDDSDPASACTACFPGELCAGSDAGVVPCDSLEGYDDDEDPATECVSWTDCVDDEEVDGEGTATSDRTCLACPAETFSTGPNARLCTPPPSGAALVGGELHACALMSDTSVTCWGGGLSGQRGDGTTTNSSVPVAVSGLSGVAALAAGVYHTCALLLDGTVSCFGQNSGGQLGNGTTDNSGVPVAVSGLSGAIALGGGTGSRHSCAILGDRSVACWGANSSGELGDGTNTDSSVPVAVVGLSGAVSLALGEQHSCAALQDGTAYCWGYGSNGQLGNGASTTSNLPVAVSSASGVVALASGSNHSCALLASGGVSCWGYNSFGQLGDGTNTTSNIPVAVSGLSGADRLAAYRHHACARVGDGTLRCWGYNAFGQLGNGNKTNSNVPVTVAGLSGAIEPATGLGHSCATLEGGGVSCWGYNFNGQLGNGNSGGSASSLTPVAVAFP